MKVYIKMEKSIWKFDRTYIRKQKFNQNKRPISIKNIDLNKIVVSNKVYFGKKVFKYLIGYKDGNNNWPWCIFLSKMSAYGKDFDETIYMSF